MSLRIKSPLIDCRLPRVFIDQYRCFAEAGLKNNGDLGRELVRLSKQAYFKSLARTVQEGDRMARIENHIPTRTLLAQFARERARPDLEFNVERVPQSRPKIMIEEGYVKIDWRAAGGVIDKSV